jgi:hypothetical protein
MSLFDEWCSIASDEDRRKRLLKLAEKSGGRATIDRRLIRAVRSHYDRLDRIANDVAELGYGTAATILKERLPRTDRARSGELAEILATEFTEAKLNFNVPVRRLRYKDGREMALRGDDFIGAGYDENNGLWLLKGESKSRKRLGKSTVAEAREALIAKMAAARQAPCFLSPIVCWKVMAKTPTWGGPSARRSAPRPLPPSRIDHVVFTLSGNDPIAALKEDLEAAATDRNQTSVNIQIEDHEEFIASVYEKAGDLGND